MHPGTASCNPGADVVVLGSCTSLQNNGEKRIRLDIRLQDTARGKTIAEQAVTGNENELYDGFFLASARSDIKHSEALQTLAIFRKLPKPSNEDARIDVAEAAAWINVDDNKAMAAAKRAIETARALPVLRMPGQCAMSWE